MRWWLLLVLLLLVVPSSHAQEQVPPRITIGLEVTPADVLLRPTSSGGTVLDALETTARLDVSVTCQPDPVMLLPYEGQLDIALDAPVFSHVSFSPTGAYENKLSVPLTFDLETCDPERPWTASYELTYHMSRFGFDALEQMDFEAEASYKLPDDTFPHAEGTVRWSENAAGWIHSLEFFMPQYRVFEVEPGIWLLEDVAFSMYTNGRVTVEGLILSEPSEGRVWFEPEQLLDQDWPFTDDIRTYWAGNDTTAIGSVRLGYRLTVDEDPAVELLFEHPGLAPVDTSSSELWSEEAPSLGLVAWWGVLGILLVLFARGGRRDH